MNEWQPIETAPKDGVTIICWDGLRVDMWRWDKQQHNTRPKPYWARVGLWRARDDRSCQPTHWMPLPEPPTTP